MEAENRLRDLSRHAVRTNIAAAAERLFLERGFAQTTIDDIADAVGMSQRSFFRYFPSKEDAVLASYDETNDAVVELLTLRPKDEDPWESLTEVCRYTLTRFTSPHERAHAIELHRIILDTPSLLAAHLQRLDATQERLTDVLLARINDHDIASPSSKRALARAIVGAAFAILNAINSTTSQEPDTSAEPEHFFTSLMSHLRPAWRSPAAGATRDA